MEYGSEESSCEFDAVVLEGLKDVTVWEKDMHLYIFSHQLSKAEAWCQNC